ncbi:hypothetical protein JCM3775_003164 [Rhodotorula graminis]
MPSSGHDKSAASARDPDQDLLLGQVEAMYRSLANPPTAGLKGSSFDKARSRAQIQHASSKALGVARSLWGRNWAFLVPAERAAVLEVVLRAYCGSRRKPAAFDWAQLNYVSVLDKIGGQNSFYEADLDWHGPAETQKDDAPWLEVRKHVGAIVDACACARPDALNRMRHWKTTFLDEGGITRLKLRRLVIAEREAVASEVELILEHVHKHLSTSTSSAIDTFLPSADAVFARAHRATESDSNRFNVLRGFIDDLVNLYSATSKHADAVAQLSATRDLLERRTHVQQDDGVVDMRTAEASFAKLEVPQQVAAVEQGRNVVFEVCLQHREAGQLPAVEPLINKLLEPLHDPRAVTPLKLWRLCIDNLSAVVRLYEAVYKEHEHVAKSLSNELAILDTYQAAELFVDLPEDRQVAAVERCRSMVHVLSSVPGPLPTVDDVVANFLHVLPHPGADPVYRDSDRHLEAQ